MAVELVASWGSMVQLAGIANLSYGGTKKYTQKTAKQLVEKIIKLGHTSVLEFGGATFYVKTPIFVARQWMRHRHFSYLERSGRYTKFTEESIPQDIDPTMREELKNQLEIYAQLLENHKKEDARAVLGTGFLTEFYVSGNLRAWANFLKLRLTEHAQKEIRVEAEAILHILNTAWDGLFSRGWLCETC